MRLSAPLAALCGLALGVAPILGGAAGASSDKPAAPKPVVVSSADRGCTLSPSLDYSGGEQASCIAVGAKLSKVPAVGQTAVLKVTVKAGRAEADTRVTIDLPSTFAFADGTQTSAAVNGTGRVARADGAAMSLSAGSSRTFTRVVKAVRAGFGEIAVSAKNRLSAARTDGGTSSVFVTTGATANASFLGQAASTKSRSVARHNYPSAGRESTGTKAAPLPALTRAAGQVAAHPNTAGTACATGTWNYVDQNGSSRPAFNTLVEVLNPSNTLLSYAVSNGDGSYNICWSTGGVATSVYVKFVESNNAWSVVDESGNTYSYSTGIVSVPDGTTQNFGNLYPGSSSDYRGLHAFDEANDEYQWIYQSSGTAGAGCWSPFQTTCQHLTIHWASDSTTGTFWNTSGAYLLAGSPDTLDEPVHEYGHALMYYLYDESFPATTNCSSHDLFVTSSTTCGFTEGWADWVATSVYNNMVWTYNGGGTRNMDVTWNEGSGYPDGDQVEARIVQAMRSLTDGTKAPFDNDPGEGSGIRDASKFFTALADYEPTTFAAFWSDRAALGQDTSQTALSALYQGTIDYGFRNPLSDYVGKHLPEAVPNHSYSFTTTTNYWSAVAVKPDTGSDVDLTLYNDFNETAPLASSAYGGTTTDFVAVNSNSGVRALQTYYPVVHEFAGTGGYTIQSAQGSNGLSAVTSAAMLSTQPLRIWDSYQTASVPVFFRAVPTSGSQDVQLASLAAGGTVVPRSSSLQSADPGAGNAATLTYTPSTTGWSGVVLLNNSLTTGTVNVYADTSAPTGTIAINSGHPTSASPNVTLALSASDPTTGLLAMQVSTDGVFDTEPVVPYSTTASATIPGTTNGIKTVYVRYENNAGMWSAPVSDTIKLHAAPVITSITPASGSTAGGNTVTIHGKYLTDLNAVKFGTTAATSFTVVSSTKATAVAPAHTPVNLDIKVTGPYGTSTTSAADKYKYVAAPAITSVAPTSGPAAGGTTVTITGTSFTAATAVKFGTVAATSFTVVSPTKIHAVAPAHATGRVDVNVTTAGGTSATVTGDRYHYV
jgi:hypothetical protein